MTAEKPPLADGRYVAVLDRFEELPDGNERAVLLLESDEAVVAERAIPRWRLPGDARHPDAVLAVRLRSGFVVSLGYDPDATERRRSAAQSRFDALADRPGENGDE